MSLDSINRSFPFSEIVVDSSCLLSPVPATAPMPHRKLIRVWLLPFSRRRTAYALLLVVQDLLLFAGSMFAIVWVSSVLLKILFGLIAGFMIGRLFILGHDACHQSFTAHRRLNAWIGRLVFLPSLTPYSLWETGHNVVHHGYTGLKGFDFVWQPLTLEDYRALPSWRRALERVYRSGWAPWLYYLVEVWWLRMYFPRANYLPTRRPIFRQDCLLVSIAALTWIAALGLAARATGQSPLLLVGLGFVLPFLFWNAMIGFVVYVHHTHVAVAWHAEKAAWARAQPFVSTTVHLTFRGWLGLDIGALLHHITEHTAHHVDMGIPLYGLRPAQAVLERLLPGRIVVQEFSWRWYFDTARRTKLYDFEAQRWTDFCGRPTTPAARAGPAPMHDAARQSVDAAEAAS